ncbi:MAG: ADOP family duplicated permease [Bryobacteraceae bacterium]
MSEVLRRMRALFRRDRLDRDLEEEMRLHLEMKAAETGDPAAARRAFGNPLLLREKSKDLWAWRWLDALARDMRYALRTLRRSPGFTAVAVLILALGIGGGITVFSLTNALLLNPFPYPEPDRMVDIQVGQSGRFESSVPVRDFFDWREQNQVFEEVAAYGYDRTNVSGIPEPERMFGGRATAGFLRVLGVQPALGRFFTPAEDAPGGPAVAVLSYGLWARQFGGRADVLGQKLIVNGEPHQIIGVMPGRLPLPGMFSCEFWRPAAYNPSATRGTWWTGDHAIARLKPGVSLAQAQSNLAMIARRLSQQYPDTNKGREATAVRIGLDLVRRVRGFLTAPVAAVGLVLLAACANLAGLLLARGVARSREMAMRASLGAGRRRLALQVLTESVLLSLAGGAMGLWLARWGIRAVVAVAPPASGLGSALRIDGPVLWFALAVSVLTGISFGLVPAVCGSRPNPNLLLKDAPEARRRNRLVAGLVIAEIALATVLLVGGGLLMKSYAGLLRVDAGFNTDNLLTFQLGLQGPNYGSDQRRAMFFGNLLARLRLLPGVRAASAVSPLPMSMEYAGGGFQIEGRPASKELRAQYLRAAPGYFRTMGIPVLMGREFEEKDNQGPGFVAIVNEALVRRFFPGENPLGRRISGTPIVGVVGDLRHNGPSKEPEPQIYGPLMLRAPGTAHFAIRTLGDPMKLVSMVRGEVRALDPDLPLDRLKPMTQVVADSVADSRTITWMFGGFALFAMTLATLGIYGVIAYSVNQRTHEIGVRAALGADSARILAMVVRRGAWLGLAGVAIGLPLALGAARLLRSLLFGVGPHDAGVLAGVSGLLLAVALAASYLPARRATRIDPMETLRHE